MLAIQHVKNFWSHIVVYGTILLNGAMQVLGMIFHLLLILLTYVAFIALRPMNKEELFNLCHASARNVIERIFGVLKWRFRILLLAPEYGLDVQAQIPTALCAIHNFI